MSTLMAELSVEQTPSARWSKPVSWYRTPLDPKILRQLHERRDLDGWIQTLGYLGVLVLTGSLVAWSWRHWPWPVTAALVFLHGMGFAFQINAVHELGHGTVFRTRSLNWAFERVFAFLGWINFLMFDVGHVRHHQFTLHPPDDLEVTLPVPMGLKDFFQTGFINYLALYRAPRDTIRVACGKFYTEWFLALFPASDPAKRRPAVRWARTMLLGHGLILVVSIIFRLWWLPVVTTLAPFYGSWLFFLCNNTQHIGLQDNVSDFRLCCRTFTLNPVVRFLYWHMNYHIEHHMYAGVPCYRLGRLHRLIQHELPPCPRGIAATWREIAAILKIQKTNPRYQHVAVVPPRAAPGRALPTAESRVLV